MLQATWGRGNKLQQEQTSSNHVVQVLFPNPLIITFNYAHGPRFSFRFQNKLFTEPVTGIWRFTHGSARMQTATWPPRVVSNSNLLCPPTHTLSLMGLFPIPEFPPKHDLSFFFLAYIFLQGKLQIKWQTRFSHTFTLLLPDLCRRASNWFRCPPIQATHCTLVHFLIKLMLAFFYRLQGN